MSVFLRKYATGSGANVRIPIIKRDVADFAVSADWTPAAGDVKISIDGGAAANIGTLPTAVTMGNTAYWNFVLSDAELTGKTMTVTVADSATKAVEDQAFIIETYGNASAMYPTDWSVAHAQQTGDSFARIGALGAGLTALGDARIANLDAAISSRGTYSGGNITGNLSGSVGSVTGLTVAHLDVAVSSRLATAGYTAPDNAGIGTAAAAAAAAAGDANTAAAQATTAAANSTTILARLGAFTGTGINTILGFFRALMRKDAALTPSDVGGTFDNTTDSNEAMKDAGASGGLTSPQDEALTRIDRTVKGIASKRE